MPYTTPDDVREWLGLTEDDLSDDMLVRPIRFASKDIDAAAGAWTPQDDTGLKFEGESLTLTAAQVRAVNEATCAQVEYRLTMGDDFMVKEQHDSESGPDYGTSGKVRKVCGMAYTELHKVGLLRLTGHTEKRGGNRGCLPTP